MADHPHDHNGYQRSFQENKRVLLIAILITATIMAAEVVGGLLSGSLALLSDAGHMFMDVLALGLSMFAAQFALRPPSSKKTFGFYRMEIIVALINGSMLICLSVYLLYEAYRRMVSPREVDSVTMLVVAAIGLAANVASAAVMMRQSRQSLNIKGAYLHVISDALSSIGVVIGGIIILYTGWYIVDPIISMMICLVIIRGAVVLVLDSTNILLESVPKDLDIDEIRKELLLVNGVKDVHHMHVWTITSGVHALSAHVLVDDMPMRDAGQIMQEVKDIMRERYGVSHTTIQIECEICMEDYICCLNSSGGPAASPPGSDN